MKVLFHTVILLNVFYVVFAAVDPFKDCEQGDSNLDGPAPRLNITVSPSTTIVDQDPLKITCSAEAAPAVQIYVGALEAAAECSGNPVTQCSYMVTSFIAGLPRRVSCLARSADGKCRVKSLIINVTDKVPPLPSVSQTQISISKTEVAPSPSIVPPLPSVIKPPVSETQISSNKTIVPPLPSVIKPPVSETQTSSKKTEVAPSPSIVPPLPSVIKPPVSETQTSSKKTEVAPSPSIVSPLPPVSQTKTEVAPSPSIVVETMKTYSVRITSVLASRASSIASSISVATNMTSTTKVTSSATTEKPTTTTTGRPTTIIDLTGITSGLSPTSIAIISTAVVAIAAILAVIARSLGR